MKTIKIYIGTDIEGVSGVVDFEQQTAKESRYYEEAKSLLTAEVNAAVEGILEAKGEEVEDILVIDGHGAGGIKFTELHEEARLEMGRPLRSSHERFTDYDVAFMIGQHAKMGSGGNLEHTYSSEAIHNIWLNDNPVGELEMNMLFAGENNVPYVLVTGDQIIAEEAQKAVPGIETVIVKEAITQSSAICISPVKARQKIKEGAVNALERYQEIEPYQPYSGKQIELKVEFAARAVSAAFSKSRREGVEQIDNRTIRIVGESIEEVWSRYQY